MDQKKVGEYLFIRELGKGAFAIVYEAIHEKSGLHVAIKMIKKAIDVNYKEEINAMKKLTHPLLPLLYEVIEDETTVYIIMEYFEGDSLLTYVNLRTNLAEDVARDIFGQLVMVLDYLNSKHIMHRDLKAENILINKNRDIMLIDFGFAKEFNQNDDIFLTFCGSVAYCSPEMVSGSNYSLASDIWGVGVLLYAMIEGKLPFYSGNIQQIISLIQTKEPQITYDVSDELTDLISRLLAKDPNSRITLTETMDHPWLSIFNKSLKCKGLRTALGVELVDPFYLDEEIIEKLSKLGYDINQLKEDLVNNTFNQMTGQYKFERKKALTKKTTAGKSTFNLTGFFHKKGVLSITDSELPKAITTRDKVTSTMKHKVTDAHSTPVHPILLSNFSQANQIVFTTSRQPLGFTQMVGPRIRRREQQTPGHCMNFSQMLAIPKLGAKPTF